MPATRPWPAVLAAVIVVFAVLAGLLVMVVPLKDGARDWFTPLIEGGWRSAIGACRPRVWEHVWGAKAVPFKQGSSGADIHWIDEIVVEIKVSAAPWPDAYPLPN